jgi:hypothetical protein
MSEFDIYLSSWPTDEEEEKSKDAYSFRSNTFTGSHFCFLNASLSDDSTKNVRKIITYHFFRLLFLLFS